MDDSEKKELSASDFLKHLFEPKPVEHEPDQPIGDAIHEALSPTKEPDRHAIADEIQEGLTGKPIERPLEIKNDVDDDNIPIFHVHVPERKRFKPLKQVKPKGRFDIENYLKQLRGN